MILAGVCSAVCQTSLGVPCHKQLLFTVLVILFTFVTGTLPTPGMWCHWPVPRNSELGEADDDGSKEDLALLLPQVTDYLPLEVSGVTYLTQERCQAPCRRAQLTCSRACT
jgi:hypothetical protein